MKEYKYKINGNVYKVAIGDVDDNNKVQVEVNGTPYEVEMEAAPKAVAAVKAPKPAAAPRTQAGAPVVSKPAASAPAGAGYQVKAPLPGVVLSVNTTVGATVSAADTVLVLEAMKMENAIHAGRDGKVTSITVNKGDSVLEGAVLLTIE
ncbi:MAG: acetyl-CoA carboxylase biotin carboxyl carrier protein subunit [Muribaculaceae bacterium]|nr:acetyl-CoA carboxylase biotin carboxyl carrier protein subunit [Muribaculaceae bacterium]